MRSADGEAWELVQQHIFPGKDDATSFYERNRWAMLFAQVLEAPHRVVVEVGSGYGVGTRCLSKARGVEFSVGVDADRDLLVNARQAAYSPQFVQANVEGTLPFRPGSIDCAIAPEVYEHFYHPERFFQDLHRVLKPRGTLILTTPNTESWALMILRRLPRPWAQRILTREAAWTAHLHPEFFGDLSAGSPHGHRVEGASVREMERLARAHGFLQVRSTTWGLPLSAEFWGKVPRPVRERVMRRFLAMAVGLRHIFVVWQRDDQSAQDAV